MTAAFFQEISLILILFFAALSDLRSRRVSNFLLAAGGVLILLLRLLEGIQPACLSLFWAVLVLLISQPIYRCGMAGAADIKMVVLIIACCPDGKGLLILLLAALSGGFCALLRLLRGRLWKRRLQHLMWYVGQLQLGKRPKYYLYERDGEEASFPLAGFFLFGAVLGFGILQ